MHSCWQTCRTSTWQWDLPQSMISWGYSCRKQWESIQILWGDMASSSFEDRCLEAWLEVCRMNNCKFLDAVWPIIIAVHWNEPVWQRRKALFIENMDFPQSNITLCSADWFIQLDCLQQNNSPEDPLKYYWMRGRNISCNNRFVV